MLIKTHTKTKQRLLLKNDSGLVSTLFLIDSNDNKIKDGYNTKGEQAYKVVVCLNESLNQ